MVPGLRGGPSTKSVFSAASAPDKQRRTEPISYKNSLSLRSHGSQRPRQRLAPLGSKRNLSSSALVDIPDYQDAWPDVEISISILEIFNFSLEDSVFGASFDVHLDWLDDQLKRNVHYFYNVETRMFEFTKKYVACREDWRQFFDPRIKIENACLHQDEEEITFGEPQVIDEREDDVPWMSKRIHYRGYLTCGETAAHHFPLDLELLDIRIVSAELIGKTRVETDRAARLCEPSLRRQHRQGELHDKDYPWFRVTNEPSEALSHVWLKRSTYSNNTLKVGEMELTAMCGARGADPLHYRVVLLFRRKATRYIIDFFTQALNAVLACFSFFVPLGEDMLANRMGITLTILLTIVASTTSRPVVVQSLPYPTWHDYFEQRMVMCVVIVCIENVLVFWRCWHWERDDGEPGTSFEDGVEKYWDTALHMTREREQWGWPLEQSWCDSYYYWDNISRIDGWFFCFMMLSITLILLQGIVAAQKHCITVITATKFGADKEVASDDAWSQLVLVLRKRRGFLLIPRGDSLSAARHVALLPGVRCFMFIWDITHRMAETVRKHFQPPNRHQIMTIHQVFHPTKLKQLWEGRDRARQQSTEAPSLVGTLCLDVSGAEGLRVVDVGSGEVGFYTLCGDVRYAPPVTMDAAPKLKVETELTFREQFLDAEGGAAELAEVIAERLGLVSAPSARAAFEILTAPGAAESRQISLALGCTGPFAKATLAEAARNAEPVVTTLAGGATTPASASVESVAPGAVPEVAGEGSPGTVPEVAGGGSLGDACAAQPQVEVFLGVTGLSPDELFATTEDMLEQFCREVNANLAGLGADRYRCVLHVLSDCDESAYELCAAQWLIQHGDLEVMHLVRLYHVNRLLQSERATLKEVLQRYASLNADADLRVAFAQALASAADVGLQHPRSPGSEACARVAPAGQSALHQTCGVPPADTSTEQPAVPRDVFYRVFEQSEPLLRALAAETFAGTLAMGGTSIRLARREACGSKLFSAPIGSRTPTARAPRHPLLNEERPMTKQRAECFLADGELPPGGTWGQERLQQWRDLIHMCLVEYAIPSNEHNLFLGISGVFHVADSAGCANKLLSRDDFLTAIWSRAKAGNCTGREFANLVLVHDAVAHALHKSARIVCKRNWTCSGRSFVVAWPLGLFLEQDSISKALSIERHRTSDGVSFKPSSNVGDSRKMDLHL